MLQLLNDSSFIFLADDTFMENADSTRTSPTKVSEIETDKPNELKIFKTSKPIKDNTDERALTSKKSKKEKDGKHGFFHKIGFGSKSASVSPVKNLISIPRRSSDSRDEKQRKIQRKKVEAAPPPPPQRILESSESKTNNDDDDEVFETDKSRNPTPISCYETTPTAATGTESDARVSQTIIMKKRTCHEAKTEACLSPYGKTIQPSHARAVLDVPQPHKATVSATVNVDKPEKSSNIFTSCKPSMMKQSISDSFSPSKKSLASISSSKASSNATLSTTVSASTATRSTAAPSQGKSELDLSAPLSRLGLTMATEKPEGSLAEKLSRSFFDLTQGSQDRLQRWKNKLQTGKQRHSNKMTTKDMSEPPEGTLPGLSDMESLLEWTSTDKPKFVSTTTTTAAAIPTKRVNSLGPRPLHPSRSATNALNSSAFDQDVYLSEGSSGMIKRGSFREANMEHRTLKPRENLMEKPIHGSHIHNNNPNIHYQNMKNLQQLVQTIEGYSHRDLDLPPPARILPYSGIKPQDNGIIRPIAFRPLNQTKESTSVTELAIKSRENSRSIGNLASTAATVTPRQRTSGIASTSSASNLFPLVKSNSGTKITDENDYDTVPEFIERKSDHSDPTADNYSLIYNFQQSASAQHRRAQSGASSAGSGGFHHYHLTGQCLTSSNSSSTTSGIPNSPPHSAGSSVKKSASRHSGLHITPSPSDSGIVDYETLIRDKESELTSVRSAMEQNEEVLVRVYQEKERQYRDQMNDLRQKLLASQQGEATLRQQLRQTDEERLKLQRGFDSLSEEKSSLQKKCQQIERELYTIRNRFEDFVKDTKAAQAAQKGVCESCRRQKPQIVYENGTMGNGVSGKAPIPAPRLSKETDRQLRNEVDDMRGEISTLRDQLNTQMQIFAEERRRWEQERKHRSPSPKTQFRNASQDQRTAVLLSNDRLI